MAPRKRAAPRPYSPGDEALRRQYVMSLGLGMDTALLLWSMIHKEPGATVRDLAEDVGSTMFYVRAYLRELESSGLIAKTRHVPKGVSVSWRSVGELPDPGRRLPGMYPSRIHRVTAVLEEQDEPLTTAALAKAVGCRTPALERTLAAMTARGEVTHCGVDEQDRDLWA